MKTTIGSFLIFVVVSTNKEPYIFIWSVPMLFACWLFLLLLQVIEAFTAVVISAYFVSVVHVTSTLLLLLLQTKALIHTTQVKTFALPDIAALWSIWVSSSFSLKTHPCAPILHPFPPSPLTADVSAALRGFLCGGSVYILHRSFLIHPEQQNHRRCGETGRFRTQWSLLLCVFTC